MTHEELLTYPQFKGLRHYDGNDKDELVPDLDPNYSLNSATTTDELDHFLSNGGIPKYVEFHTGDDGTVGYEVLFWVAR